jgi:integrase/recombinase XerD
VTRLRQIMLEELRRRNYAESSIHIYIHTVEHFSPHSHHSPGSERIRQYQSALFTRWKLAPNTVTQRLAALRFFYVQVLKRGWSVAESQSQAFEALCPLLRASTTGSSSLA